MLNRIGLNDVTTTKCDINDKTHVAETQKYIWGKYDSERYHGGSLNFYYVGCSLYKCGQNKIFSKTVPVTHIVDKDMFAS